MARSGSGNNAHRQMLFLAGCLAIVDGVIALIGWFFGLTYLYKPLAAGSAMSFNSAIAFVFAGWAMIAAIQDLALVRRLLALLTFLLSVGTLAGQSLGLDPSVGSLLALPPAGARMAPFTALSFAAISIVIMSLDRVGVGTLPLDLTMFGVAVIPVILGLIPIVSLGLGMIDLSPWGPHFAAMALQTAIGLTFLGTACCLLVRERAGSDGRLRRDLIRPVAASVAAALVCWAMFDSVLTAFQKIDDRLPMIRAAVQVDDATTTLDRDLEDLQLEQERFLRGTASEQARRDAALRVRNDYRALASLTSGSDLEPASKAAGQLLAATLDSPTSPALLSELETAIAAIRAEAKNRIQSISRVNPSSSLVRRDLIGSWVVCVAFSAIALGALWMELRKRLVAESLLRRNELDLRDRVVRRTAELQAEILENREVHARLSASELRFRSTFEQAAVGLVHASPDGLFIRVNEKFCAIIGYSREQLLGMSFREITHEADKEADQECVEALLHGRIAGFSREKRYLRRDAQCIWANVTASLVRNSNGEPDYVIAAVEDISVRKSAEQQLQTSESRYRWLVEASPVGIVEPSPSGEVITANAAFYKLIGWTPAEFARERMTLRDLTPAEWMEVTESNVACALETGLPAIYEKEYVRRDGTRVPVLVGLSFRRESPSGWMTFVLDMTPLKRSEELLRVSERRFRMVVEASPNAMITIGANGFISMVNAQAEKLFGYTRDELVGQPVGMLLPSRFRSGHAGYVAGYLSSPEARAMGAHDDLFGLRKDGSEVPVEIGLSPIAADEGPSILAAIVDVTRRKTAEAAARESARQVAMLADAMPQIVWTARPDGYLDYYNARWYEFTGFDKQIGGDESWTPLLHPDDIKRCLETWYSSVATGEPYEIEYRFWDRRTRHWRWHLGRALPLRNNAGELVKWVGTCTDIDDRKRMSEELEERVNARTVALRRSLVEKETLLKEVHHRVKNNLQVICSLLAMQSDYAPDPVMAEPIREAHQRVASMAMIHQLLYQSETLSDINFGLYIESLAMNLFQAYCVDPARISLELDVEAIPLAINQAIPCGLILNELLSNALKHAFPGGRTGVLRVSFRQAGPARARLVVDDNGVGLPPGFQMEYAHSLGLQVVGALADDLGANLAITRNRGTQIEIEWPLSPSEPEPAVQTAAETLAS